jgi:ubiquinone/menaquinone biosynthesis C-methylase UbiE
VVENALATAHPHGEVLELACGTGIWTRILAATASDLTAVDASPEVLRINSSRLENAKVHYVEADIFRWNPHKTFDLVFFGFWLSHVPEERFDAFWATVRRCLRPGGKAFFVDSLAAPEGTAHDQRVQLDGVVERRLNDGRTYRVVKVFHEPAVLQARLRKAGWEADIRATPNFFIYGTVQCEPPPNPAGS